LIIVRNNIETFKMYYGIQIKKKIISISKIKSKINVEYSIKKEFKVPIQILNVENF